MQRLCDKLFDFKIQKDLKISCTKNELYNQLLLYIFNTSNKNILIVTSTLNDANKLYNELKNYTFNVYIFPDDDYLTKKSIAVTPELLFMRMKILNEYSSDLKKIVICHCNSFLKKIEDKGTFDKRNIILKKHSKIDKKDLENKFYDIGYIKENIVTSTSEYAIRGYIVDIFPLFCNHPIRIEFFDDEIESIREFDENSQLSLKELESIKISPVSDESHSNKTSNIIDYLNDPVVIYQNLEQIRQSENVLFEQINFFDKKFSEYYKLDEIDYDNIMYFDTINNKNYDLYFEANNLNYYYDVPEKFIFDSKNSDKQQFFCTNNPKIINFIKDNFLNIQIIDENINDGFEYMNNIYYSDNNLSKGDKKSNIDVNYKIGQRYTSIDKIKEGDYVVHKKYGIGVYCGITTITKNKISKDYILINYKNGDKLYLQIEDIDKLYKYSVKEGIHPSLSVLGGNEWSNKKKKVKEKIRELADKLLLLYKERASIKVEPYSPDEEYQKEFESSFQYETTADQEKSSKEIKNDLERGYPMNRLLCGDVGYGKTEVIFRAIFKTIVNGKQVMYLCPTTLLSSQQYESALKRFSNYKFNIALLNRFVDCSVEKNIIEKFNQDKIELLIGTHKLLNSKLNSNNLGLVIIDEEHKFGVEQKEKLKQLNKSVHVLTVSATPIPRSLQMSMTGICDFSLIETPPKNRFPVQTYVISYSDVLIREAILKEISRNGQCFILYNKVETMSLISEKYKRLVPEAKICYAHAKLKKSQITDTMKDFKDGKYDVLISTTIIENGIDIPNANTLIVVDADLFGLSQLYQIRGRIGRGDRIAYAYLMYNKNKMLNETAMKRLEAIKEFTQLGSGYKISMRDLSIRGAGDILGREQAGFIDSIGIDLYLELVNEEINGKIDSNEEEKVIIDDVENHIDRHLVPSDEEIIEIYKKIGEISDDEDFNSVNEEIKDRYGYIDENLKTYIIQEYCEKLLTSLNIAISENKREKLVIKIPEKTYKKINVEELFSKALSITTNYTFYYKTSYIFIKLNKLPLEKHYIYYLIELLRYIKKTYN